MPKTRFIASAFALIFATACTTALTPTMPTTIVTQTSDGVTIFGDTYFADLDASAPLILLFHQGGADGRSEYAPIVGELNQRGYRAIAWDQRAGGDRFGGENRTVQNLATPAETYCEAQPDLQAALDFVIENELAETVIIWGSSYSGALVFELAANNPDQVSGVIAFSPAAGGPMEGCMARQWAASIDMPRFVLRPSSEMTFPSAVEQEAILAPTGVEFLVVEDGVHGSSMLVDERTNAPMEATRARVFDWLSSVSN